MDYDGNALNRGGRIGGINCIHLIVENDHVIRGSIPDLDAEKILISDRGQRRIDGA